MYANINNTCNFEGRLVKDPELSYIPTKDGKGLAKTKFTIAVDKNMTKQQKDAAKLANQPTSDFIPCELVGPRAETFAQWFKKGKPVKVSTCFRSYSYDAKDGTKKYAYSFDVVDFGFVVADYSDASGANNNGGNAGYNGGFNQDFVPVDDGDMPF